MQIRKIEHPVLGAYEQQIFDTPTEAGHADLASKGKYGWEIPPDIPTARLLNNVSGCTILDLGCGWGSNVVIPAIEKGAEKVFACDITPEHLEDGAPIAHKARELGYEALRRILAKEDWWKKPLSPDPLAQPNLEPLRGKLPENESIDIIVARHVLHFGDPDAILNVFDLASSLLAPGGKLVSINFTEYVAFIYNYDQGATLNKIINENERYRLGETTVPGGYLSASNTLGLTLAELMRNPDFKDRDYLCFDDDTLRGLLGAWKASRRERGLPVDLEVANTYLFTPAKIAKHNSLTKAGFQGKENHYFELLKRHEPG